MCSWDTTEEDVDRFMDDLQNAFVKQSVPVCSGVWTFRKRTLLRRRVRPEGPRKHSPGWSVAGPGAKFAYAFGVQPLN